MLISFGTGNVLCSWGKTTCSRQDYALSLEITEDSHAIGEECGEVGDRVTESDSVALLKFSNIESARVLQDTLNEMICAWARDKQC